MAYTVWTKRVAGRTGKCMSIFQSKVKNWMILWVAETLTDDSLPEPKSHNLLSCPFNSFNTKTGCIRKHSVRLVTPIHRRAAGIRVAITIAPHTETSIHRKVGRTENPENRLVDLQALSVGVKLCLCITYNNSQLL